MEGGGGTAPKRCFKLARGVTTNGNRVSGGFHGEVEGGEGRGGTGGAGGEERSVLGGLVDSLAKDALAADAVVVKVLQGLLLGLTAAERLQVRLGLCPQQHAHVSSYT